MHGSGAIQKALLAERRDRYVAFVDLLGFGDRVARDWDNAAAVYDAFVESARLLRSRSGRHFYEPETCAEVQFWSDSAVIIGDRLDAVAEECQAIQTGALLGTGMLVRGGLSKGPHASAAVERHMYVVSSALNRAVNLEKKYAHYPRIVLDPSLSVDEEGFSLMRGGNGYFMPSEDGLCMIQPFVPDWSKRDTGRLFDIYSDPLSRLVETYRESPHLPKYEWMLAQVDRAIQHFEALREIDPINDLDD